MASIKFLSIFTLVLVVNQLSAVLSYRTYDNYVIEAKSDCDSSKSIISCFKYRLGRYLWSFQLDALNFDKRATDGNEFYEFVALNSTNTDSELFPEARYTAGEGELTKGYNFVKRAISHFAANNGIRLGIDEDSGIQIESAPGDDEDEIETGRGKFHKKLLKKKKKKLKIIFPIIAMMKLFGIKILLKLVLLSIGLVQLMVLGAGGGLFLYLRRNTLCKVQPYLVHTSSHTQSESELPYSSEKWPVSVSAYNKDWASARAYQGQRSF